MYEKQCDSQYHNLMFIIWKVPSKILLINYNNTLVRLHVFIYIIFMPVFIPKYF